jgi:hypothetical protein
LTDVWKVKNREDWVRDTGDEGRGKAKKKTKFEARWSED